MVGTPKVTILQSPVGDPPCWSSGLKAMGTGSLSEMTRADTDRHLSVCQALCSLFRNNTIE